MELQHFSDDHPLIFNKAIGNYCTCNGCDENIPEKNSCYSCRKCDFDLHPSCAELARELQHPLHGRHPLILQKTPPYDKRTCTCKICGELCKMWRFVYHCPLCKFDAHVKCVSLSLSIDTEIHNHPLTLFGKFITFICDFCGKEGKSMPYLCGSTCGFWAHFNCASLPRMVKRMCHKHPLILTNSIKDDHSEHRVCQLCEEHIDANHGVYYCSSCDYVAHLDCTIDKNGIDENFMQESKGKKPTELTNIQDSGIDEFTNKVSYSVQKTKVGVGEIKMPIEIKHFCYEHDLKLTNELENYKICDGCVWPIFSPFYSCTKCNLFLHKSCAELPCTPTPPQP